MLRKDVKLGFAIGGILLAVLVVYVLVVPAGDRHAADQARLQGTEDGKGDAVDTPVTATTPRTDTLTDDKNAPAPEKMAPDKPADTAAADKPAGDKAQDKQSDAKNNSAAPPADKQDLWADVLSTGKNPTPPVLFSSTETPSPNGTPKQDDSGAAKGNSDSGGLKPVAVVTGSDVKKGEQQSASPSDSGTISQKPVDINVTPKGTSADQEKVPAGATTHLVQSGETLSSIAAVAYGNARYWHRIAEANPKVNPNRVTPGTTLILPAAGADKTAAAATGGSSNRGADAAVADPQTQYKVQSGDSLYRIAMKLYGKSDMADKIYDANKDLIGPDRAKLKLNSILKLPEPPSNTATASR